MSVCGEENLELLAQVTREWAIVIAARQRLATLEPPYLVGSYYALTELNPAEPSPPLSERGFGV